MVSGDQLILLSLGLLEPIAFLLLSAGREKEVARILSGHAESGMREGKTQVLLSVAENIST